MVHTPAGPIPRTLVRTGTRGMHRAIQRTANRAVAGIDAAALAAHSAVDCSARLVGEQVTAARRAQDVYGAQCREAVIERPLTWAAGAFVAGYVLARILR